MRIRTKIIVKNYELEERRRNSGLSQKDFAELVNIPLNVYQGIESLKIIPNEEQAKIIALELDADTKTLFPRGYERLVDVIKATNLDRIVKYHNPLLENAQDTKFIEATDAKMTVGKLIQVLPQREREVIELRNGFYKSLNKKIKPYPRTLEDTAKIMGVSRERIRQIEAKAHERMRIAAINKKMI